MFICMMYLPSNGCHILLVSTPKSPHFIQVNTRKPSFRNVAVVRDNLRYNGSKSSVISKSEARNNSLKTIALVIAEGGLKARFEIEKLHRSVWQAEPKVWAEERR